ncbi:MAG: transglycosylase family protein [Chloroflexi bacterium]|nr:transglycosylase family protein [Chloroflexota bacterium]
MEATLHAVATPPPPPPPPPTPRPVVRATPEPRATTYSGDSVWDDLAQCESGGNWSINTGNGYYGGLQFNYGTWHDYGGGEFAEYPHQATREEQIAVAERLRAARGYAPWPACRTKLGLP